MFGRRKRQIVRLLVVEDEPLVAFDNEHVLSDAGFVIVATVPAVAQARRLILSGVAIDLVVSDIRLMDGSGLDVARVAREQGVPVLFVTGQCPPEAQSLAVGCLDKPYAPRDLVAAIHAVDAHIAGTRQKKLPAGLRMFEAA